MKLKRKKKKALGICVFCGRKAKAKHECLTCERQGKPVYTVCACRQHATEGQARIKRHVLVAHPSNMVRAVLHQLRGDDVF